MDENNKRIAKNTIFLYFRALLSVLIGLYTSRVVLNVLGVEDYGLYGLVGGCVSMFTFLNGAMGGATSRFFSFELGRKAYGRLKDTVSTAVIVHFIIGLVIALLSETVGMWFLLNKLVIPEGRMFAAQIVLHVSVVMMLLTVVQGPFNACIIAREHMHIYAYLDLANSFLKLGIVYLLTLSSFDKLIFYVLLQLAVTVLIFLAYVFYCRKHFPESHIHWVWKKSYLKPMLSFSGWDLFGNMSVTARNQGANFLINLFFGVAYNAAASVALTVYGTILGLCNNIVAAFRPQIIKQYSVGNYSESVNLIYNAAKFSAFMLVIISVPTFFEMDTLMELWLKTPPSCASLFCRILLFSACLNIIEVNLNTGIHASGKVRTMSVLTGLCYLMHLPIQWACYRMGLPVEANYFIMIFTYLFSSMIKAILLKSYIPPFGLLAVLKNVYVPVVAVVVVTSACVFFLYEHIDDKLLNFIAVYAAGIVLGCLSAAYIGLNKAQREMVYGRVKSFLNKHKA